MKNPGLAPMVLLLALLALAWTGLFGLAEASSDTTEALRPTRIVPTATPTPRPTTSPRAGRDLRDTTVQDRAGRSTGTPSRSADREATSREEDRAAGGDKTTRPGDTSTRGTSTRDTSSGETSTRDIRAASQDSDRDDRITSDRAGENSMGRSDREGNETVTHDATGFAASEPEGLSSRGATVLIIVLLILAAVGSRR